MHVRAVGGLCARFETVVGGRREMIQTELKAGRLLARIFHVTVRDGVNGFTQSIGTSGRGGPTLSALRPTSLYASSDSRSHADRRSSCSWRATSAMAYSRSSASPLSAASSLSRVVVCRWRRARGKSRLVVSCFFLWHFLLWGRKSNEAEEAGRPRGARSVPPRECWAMTLCVMRSFMCVMTMCFSQGCSTLEGEKGHRVPRGGPRRSKNNKGDWIFFVGSFFF